MTSPLNVVRNDYRRHPKLSTIPTPRWLCQQIADLFPVVNSVLDPCCGDGRLLQPFINRGIRTVGCDIKTGQDFLEMKEHIDADLCVCNPPFNLGVGKKLGSEMFLRKIIELCGDIQIALFCPMGFRLNQRTTSKRWRWLRDTCTSKITSIMSLPIDCFEGVLFHSEILFFNAPQLPPHLWINRQEIDIEN